MKRNKLLAILSVALGASALLGACNATDSSGKGKGQYTQEDFIKYREYQIGYTYYGVQAETLSKKYGEFCAYASTEYTVSGGTEALLVFKKTDKDFMNNVVETYNVYNTALNKIIFTREFKYEDIEWDAEDEYGNSILPEKYFEVGVENQDGFLYLYVYTSTNVRIDDEIIEEKELEDSYYTTDCNVEIYDRNGNLITASEALGMDDGDDCVEMLDDNDLYRKFLVGGDTVVIQDHMGQIEEIYKASEESIPVLYNYKTDKYGYVMSMGGMSLDNSLKVYELSTNKLVFTYYLDPVASLMFGGMMGLLADGRIYDLGMTLTTSENADMYMDDIGINFNPVLVDPKDGTVEAVDTGEYIYLIVVGGNMIEEMSFESETMMFTDNVVNVAMAVKKTDFDVFMNNDGSMEEVGKLLFLDDDLNVMYEVGYEDSVVVGSASLLYDGERLATGDYLLDIQTTIEDMLDQSDRGRVIVTEEGKVRSYLPANAVVVDDYIYIDGSVYDFDMNLLFSLNSPYVGRQDDVQWTYEGVVGDSILIKREDTVKKYDTETGDYEEKEVSYALIAKMNERTFNLKEIATFSNNDGKAFCEIDDNYFVIGCKEEALICNVEGQVLMRVNDPLSPDGEYRDRYHIFADDSGIVIMLRDQNGAFSTIVRYDAQEAPDNYLDGYSEYFEKFEDKDGNGIPDAFEEY